MPSRRSAVSLRRSRRSCRSRILCRISDSVHLEGGRKSSEYRTVYKIGSRTTADN